jgi:hypothetical protein
LTISLDDFKGKMSKTPTSVLISLPELPVFGSLEIPLF